MGKGPVIACDKSISVTSVSKPNCVGIVPVMLGGSSMYSKVPRPISCEAGSFTVGARVTWRRTTRVGEELAAVPWGWFQSCCQRRRLRS